MAEEGEHIKLLTIGDSGVGKSWLLLRWAGETGKLLKGASSMPTIGIDFKMKAVMVEGKRLKVQVWDTAGQERFRTITTSYYRNSQGILLVYDITNKDTFNNIRNWIQQIQLHADANVAKILIGNKCDLIKQRAVSFEEGEALAREYKIPFYETSAMNDINVDEAFMKITKDVHTKAQAGNNTSIIKSSSTTFRPGQTGISNTADIRNPPPKKSWCSVI